MMIVDFSTKKKIFDIGPSDGWDESLNDGRINDLSIRRDDRIQICGYDF